MLAGLLPLRSPDQMEADARAEAEKLRQRPLVTSLAAHVKTRWEAMKYSKQVIELRMLQCQRQRRMEYDEDKLQAIRQSGGSELYMGITSVKCRTAVSWLRDTMTGTGVDRPWSLSATPVPELPDDVGEHLRQVMLTRLQAEVQATGVAPDPTQVRDAARRLRDEAMKDLRDEAERRVQRMADKMEDQLQEGGFGRALSDALDDLTTFPFAVLKGPVIRRRKALKWQGGQLAVVEELRPEWERVDPFRFYWAPWVSDISDGPVIEHHKLTRPDLEAMIGVDGYNEAAIRSVLADFGGGGLMNDARIEAAKARAEGKVLTFDDGNKDLVDAYQLWDTVSGRMLLDWGMDKAEITDPDLSYPCEVWLVKDTVIRAVLNYDLLGRKPYYVTSFERLPGQVAGNGVADLCRDSQDMCNAAARALANNMGIASGPQVGVNISRLPAGEDVTQMFPWKIWQFKEPDFNDGSPPLSFFQPSSNAQELMAVFQQFSIRADEDTGIPRYMTGQTTPGIGRTSSGLAMLMSNAGKSMKQVVSNIDLDWFVPLLERLYQHNQHYNPDPDLMGDVNIVAKGTMSLVVRETEAVRRNEFLQIVLNSPVAQQIVGLPGAAELLRDAARSLSSNVDRVVPPQEQIIAMVAQAQQAQAMQMQAAQMQQGGTPPAPDAPQTLPDGSPAGGRDSNVVSPR